MSNCPPKDIAWQSEGAASPSGQIGGVNLIRVIDYTAQRLCRCCSVNREGKATKKFKRWLEGGTVALMSWVLVGTLILGVPMKAQAGTHVYHEWEAQYAMGAEIVLWPAEDCKGDAEARGSTALSVFRKMNASGWTSWSSNGYCMDEAGIDLRSQAETDWQDCRVYVLNHEGAGGVWMTDSEDEMIGFIIATIGLALATLLFMWLNEDYLPDRHCGESLEG